MSKTEFNFQVWRHIVFYDEHKYPYLTRDRKLRTLFQSAVVITEQPFYDHLPTYYTTTL